MAYAPFQLPTEEGPLTSIVNRHANREDLRIMSRRTMWLLAWYYLNGYRRFDQFDPSTGRISPHLLDENGDMEFQCQELLSALDRVVAKMNEMNCLPFVKGIDSSLGRIRERSIGQILLDSVVSPDQLNYQSKMTFNWMLAAYGSAGLQAHLQDHPVVGLSTDIEAIHPREIFSWPSLGQDHSKRQGIMRQHLIPVSALEEIFGKSKIRSSLKDMYWFDTDPGEVRASERESEGTLFSSYSYAQYAGNAGSGVLNTDPKKEQVGVARVRQLWLEGIRGTCSRYIIVCGNKVLADEDLSKKEAYCPIGFANFIPNGSFHGLGIFDLLYGVNRQMEFMLKQVFNNVMDRDKFGILVLPSGTYNERAITRDKGTGMRILVTSNDMMSDQTKPFHIPIPNTGDAPARTVQMAKAFMDGINPIQDLAQEKGRLESASGLQYLDEQIQKAMTNPTMGVEMAFGQCYRSLCARVARQVMISPRPIPVNRLTLDLAGAVIDPENNTVSFPDNPLPDISKLSFGVKEANPKSKSARKAEALQMVELTQDVDGLKIIALKEGLDFAMELSSEESAYELAVRNCLLVFGDGKTPGQVVFTQYIARPDIQMRIVNGFMGHPRMALASIEVQNAFADFKEALMQLATGVLPPGVPNPDDAAAQNPMNQEGGMSPSQSAGPPQLSLTG